MLISQYNLDKKILRLDDNGRHYTLNINALFRLGVVRNKFFLQSIEKVWQKI